MREDDAGSLAVLDEAAGGLGDAGPGEGAAPRAPERGSALPSFLGIGAQKCATTWISGVLAAHPEVFVPEAKELDFFTHRYERGYRWYRGELDPGPKQGVRLRGEVSPSYLTSAEAPARAKACAPDAKLLVALRDPVERAYSNHLHEIRKGHIPSGVSFEDALADNPMYVEQGRYARHLERWLQEYDRAALLVLLQEEIGEDPDGHAGRVFGFVGADPDWRSPVIGERNHESVRYRNQALKDGFRALGRAGRRAGLHAAVRRAKGAPVVGRFYRANKLDVRKEVEPMRDDTRRRLAEAFAPDTERLLALLGRDDLPWESWKLANG